MLTCTVVGLGCWDLVLLPNLCLLGLSVLAMCSTLLRVEHSCLHSVVVGLSCLLGLCCWKLVLSIGENPQI